MPESRKEEKACSEAPGSSGGAGSQESQGHLDAGLTSQCARVTYRETLRPPSQRASELLSWHSLSHRSRPT